MATGQTKTIHYILLHALKCMIPLDCADNFRINTPILSWKSNLEISLRVYFFSACFEYETWLKIFTITLHSYGSCDWNATEYLPNQHKSSCFRSSNILKGADSKNILGGLFEITHHHRRQILEVGPRTLELWPWQDEARRW